MFTRGQECWGSVYKDMECWHFSLERCWHTSAWFISHPLLDWLLVETTGLSQGEAGPHGPNETQALCVLRTCAESGAAVPLPSHSDNCWLTSNVLCGTPWTGSCNCGKKRGEGEGKLEKGRQGILQSYEGISTSLKPLPPKEPLKSVLFVYEVLKIDVILYLYVKHLYIHINLYTGFPGGSVLKNPPTNTGDSGLIPGLGRSPGEGNGNPL